MKPILKSDLAIQYLNHIKDSLTESDVDRMEQMTRWERINFIIKYFESMKLKQIRDERRKLPGAKKWEAKQIREKIIQLMGELHGEVRPAATLNYRATSSKADNLQSNKKYGPGTFHVS